MAVVSLSALDLHRHPSPPTPFPSFVPCLLLHLHEPHATQPGRCCTSPLPLLTLHSFPPVNPVRARYWYSTVWYSNKRYINVCQCHGLNLTFYYCYHHYYYHHHRHHHYHCVVIVLKVKIKWGEGKEGEGKVPHISFPVDGQTGAEAKKKKREGEQERKEKKGGREIGKTGKKNKNKYGKEEVGWMVKVETRRKKQSCWPRRPISLHPMNRTVGVGGGREGGGTTHRAVARKEKKCIGYERFPDSDLFFTFPLDSFSEVWFLFWERLVLLGMRFPSTWKRFQTIRRKNGRFELERNELKEGKEKKLL